MSWLRSSCLSFPGRRCPNCVGNRAGRCLAMVALRCTPPEQPLKMIRPISPEIAFVGIL